MKNFDVFAQIICEASGKPLEEVKLMTDAILELAGSSEEIYKDIPDTEAQTLLAKLRIELPGIQAWLAKGSQIQQ